MAPTLDEILNLLDAIASQPTRLPSNIEAFLKVYWDAHDAYGEDWLPWGTAVLDAVHDLGSDLQDYQAPGDGPLEPTLLHDREVLARVRHVLEMARRPTA